MNGEGKGEKNTKPRQGRTPKYMKDPLGGRVEN